MKDVDIHCSFSWDVSRKKSALYVIYTCFTTVLLASYFLWGRFEKKIGQIIYYWLLHCQLVEIIL